MTWLIACESSGRIRDAFLSVGIDAVSCDIEHSQAPGPHIQGDALEQIERRWAGVIAHPPCTFLCNSGSQHLYVQGGKPNLPRWVAMGRAADFFSRFRYANAPVVAVENPVPHRHAAEYIDWPDQYVQPYMFGDPFFKKTGWWLHNLPKLTPTFILPPPKRGTPEHRKWSALSQYIAEDRAAIRSITFPGMALAIALQWGPHAN